MTEINIREELLTSAFENEATTELRVKGLNVSESTKYVSEMSSNNGETTSCFRDKSKIYLDFHGY